MCLPKTEREKLVFFLGVFSIPAIVHAARLALGWKLSVNGWEVPFVWSAWVTLIFGVMAGYFYWKLELTEGKRKK